MHKNSNDIECCVLKAQFYKPYQSFILKPLCVNKESSTHKDLSTLRHARVDNQCYTPLICQHNMHVQSAVNRTSMMASNVRPLKLLFLTSTAT